MRQRIWQLLDAPNNLDGYYFVVDKEEVCSAQKVSFEQLAFMLGQTFLIGACLGCEREDGMTAKPFRFGPQSLGNAAANILQPPTLTGGILDGATFGAGAYQLARIVLTHIRVVNTDSTDHTVSLFIGGSGSSSPGTEFAWASTPVLANRFVDWVGSLPLDTVDFLTGLADDAAVLTIQGEGVIFVS